MATQMQLRGGTTAENLLFTGAQREVTVDTDKNSLVVHDGITPGGYPAATEQQVADGTYFYVDDTAGGSTANAYLLVPQSNTNEPNSYLNGVMLGFVTANANTGPATANFQGLGVKNIKYPGGVDPAPGDVFGRVTVIYDANSDWLELQKKPSASQPQIRVISAVVSGNAMTVSLDPSTIDFRAPTLNSGTVSSRVTTTQTSLIIPAGASLGTVNNVQSTIVIVAIDNAGAVELAVVNLAGGATLDETGLVNTSAIGAGSNSPNVFYSQVARAGVPYRVMGFVQSTQAAAGTWSTTPSKVQGQGGQSIIGIARINMATAQATTSGTAIDFTAIPSWAKKISIVLSGVSLSGASIPLAQLGTSSGVETTGYTGAVSGISAGGSGAVAVSTGITWDTASSAAATFSGVIRLTMASANTWIFDLAIGNTNAPRTSTGGGAKTLVGALDRVRLTASNGTDTFDAGLATIIYEG